MTQNINSTRTAQDAGEDQPWNEHIHEGEEYRNEDGVEQTLTEA